MVLRIRVKESFYSVEIDAVIGRTINDEIGQDVTDDGGELETVAGESGGNVDAVVLRV